ncbi:transposase [Catalinimonas alkaloidigena]|nr:IS5 family transposase [Catalinimonas alkaloidigena]MDF9798159.1 transposase [Catalinimonas alkaloidigena]
MQSHYTRLTDDQWKVIKQFINWQRNRELDLRNVFDAILYITRTGVQWRNLPFPNFPDWQAVYYYFDKWKKNGVIEKINLSLNFLERLQNDRQATPSLGLADSQSIKLAPMICSHRGIDGNKKVNGRKRHVLVDVRGRIYQVHVHAANFHDSPQGVNLLDEKAPYSERLETIIADKTYRGTFAKAVKQIGIEFEVPNREKSTKGFVIEAKRWVVERTFA